MISRLLLVFTMLAPVACSRPSSTGFALPGGDAGRGKEAFAALGCSDCHKVVGVTDLPSPTVQPPVPGLGGKRPVVPTDGELVTSIINPQHDIKRSFVIPTTTDGQQTRMLEYKDRMSVRQLLDVVAFLKPRYEGGVGP